MPRLWFWKSRLMMIERGKRVSGEGGFVFKTFSSAT